ncbi:hypothetical protein [Niastella sp. OAS944]|uniref:hypothetical protein n=1 Tax=Niastella sp. OAS944 TaxID=2664089 RepID=UPI00347BDA59|nr:hypothetical protein [Chitinophagaceae bacterium OAS944]
MRLLPLLFCTSLSITSMAQSRVFIHDGRQTAACTVCEQMLNDMPKEVLFGIHLYPNGDVYFTMSDKTWFNKLFTGAHDGVTADLVSKDQFGCQATLPDNYSVNKGFVLPPVYTADLKSNMKEMSPGHVTVKIGHIPPSLAKKELEGNLIIVKNGVVCDYTSFVDIDRIQWALLPMGLYTDTLLNVDLSDDITKRAQHFYTKKLQFNIPFSKGKTTYNTSDLQPLYDSLQLKDYSIKSISIRAYSSVEGATQLNNQLQKQRSQSIIKALQQFQSPEIKTTITSGENWIEFYDDIAKSPFKELASLGKIEIKKKLLDKVLLEKVETYLSNHRKAIITIYLNKRTGLEKTNADTLLTRFKQAIANKKPAQASIIRDAIFERVANGKLPQQYINQLEIPNEKIFSDLMNNQVSYKLSLNITYEYEALEDLKEIEALAPENGKVKYNICVLNFRFWQYDSTHLQAPVFLKYINDLPQYGIDPSLVKRMLINYNIVMCGMYMDQLDYQAKDNTIEYIYRNYVSLQLTDADMLALAKYLCYYSHSLAAEKLIETRVHQLDVDEDLLFYYLNLKLFDAGSFATDPVRKAALNAININGPRFCRFFNATDKGGASFQLLRYDALRPLYCESCR